MSKLALRVSHVSKEYRLGAIGGATLREELQSKIARLRGKEDPNLKIGEEGRKKNERFLALNDVSFEVRKGERIGILGHNGAGKSTLLKLICRVTTPTKGEICMNGRITSMLEVGTGFHGELTGRENIYLNGAILGLTKTEIDERFDEIVKFSEVGQFIDTPVKRYSSGMHVKLGFAVASHLDSEIMIMDEVLAVGDVTFQNKCIQKMREAAEEENRTILYVSHNMATIRQLCTRCIVLDHGRIVHDGDVQEAISIYVGHKQDGKTVSDVSHFHREPIGDHMMHLNTIQLPDMEQPVIKNEQPVHISFRYDSKINCPHTAFRVIVFTVSRTPVGMAASDPVVNTVTGSNVVDAYVDLPNLAEGDYCFRIALYEIDDNGNEVVHDVVDEALYFKKVVTEHKNLTARRWNSQVWGSIVFPTIDVSDSGLEE